MQNLDTTRLARRKAFPCPDLFGWARETEALTTYPVRTIVRRARVSPATAALIAELCGLTKEARS